MHDPWQGTASESKCSFHGPPQSDVGPDSSRGRCQPVWTPKIRWPPFSDWEIWGPGTLRVCHGTTFFGPKFFSYYVLKMCISDIFPFLSQNSRFHAKNSPICTTLAITKSYVKIGMFLAWNLEFWLKNGKYYKYTSSRHSMRKIWTKKFWTKKFGPMGHP